MRMMTLQTCSAGEREGKKINKRDCWCWYAPFFLFLFFEFTTSKFVKCVVCQVNKAFFLSIKVRFGLGVSVYKSTFFFPVRVQ